jgi:prepilin-type N-terminal cleavage/methylation domain-containing protein
MMHRRNEGFSLLELLIVVAIILIVATLALPSLLRSRQGANETSAVSNLKQVSVAESIYMSTYDVFAPLSNLVVDGLLDSRYDAGGISGYLLDVQVLDAGEHYVATATAVGPTTGRYDFYTDPDYVVRYTTTASRAPAGLAGHPVE